MGPAAVRVLYVAVFVLAGAVCLGGLFGVRSLAHPDVRRALTALLVLSGVWSLLTAVQVAVTGQTLQRVIHVGALVVGLSTVFVWLGFASAYAGRQYHRNRMLQLSALGIFLAIILAKLTNPIHGQYFASTLETEPFAHIAFNYKAPHWFVTGVSYTAAAVGFLWLFESFDQKGSRPTLLYALVIVTAVPILPYAMSGFSPRLLSINYEPLGVAVFALGVLFYARTEFENHSSPGKSALADSLGEGGLVLDESGTVIDYNERAAGILGVSTIPRAPLEEIDDELASVPVGEQIRISYDVEGEERTYEARRRPVQESLIAAEVITLKEVTRATRLEQLMGLHREVSESLVDAADPWELIRTVPETFADIDAYSLVWLYPVPEEPPEAEPPGIGPKRTDPFGDAPGAVPGIAAGEATEHAAWVRKRAEPTEPVLEAAATGELKRVPFDETDRPWSREARSHGMTGCLAVPMEFQGERNYVLGVYTAAPGGFDTPEMRVIEEVSERIPQAVERIEAHEEALLYEEAIKHAGTAISITDVDGRIQYVNPEFESLTGYTAEEAVGDTPSILKSGEMSDSHYEQLWETILAGDVFEKQFINKTKSGDRYIVRETISPVTDEEGEPKAFVAIQFDITDKILREQRLSVLNRVLRHNLRSTINVINAHTTLIEDRVEAGANGDLQESLDTIRSQTEQLLTQSETARDIEQILSLDRPDRELTTVGELAENAETTASALGGDCTVDLDEGISGLAVDAELEQVVHELVENAIVHGTDRSTPVTVTFSREDEDLLIGVEDDGPGLSEQELVVVEEGGEEPLRHGSGLGLWMVNWLSISRGGSVAASTGDSGTTISVSVPLREEDGTERETEA